MDISQFTGNITSAFQAVGARRNTDIAQIGVDRSYNSPTPAITAGANRFYMNGGSSVPGLVESLPNLISAIIDTDRGKAVRLTAASYLTAKGAHKFSAGMTRRVRVIARQVGGSGGTITYYMLPLTATWESNGSVVTSVLGTFAAADTWQEFNMDVPVSVPVGTEWIRPRVRNSAGVTIDVALFRDDDASLAVSSQNGTIVTAPDSFEANLGTFASRSAAVAFVPRGAYPTVIRLDSYSTLGDSPPAMYKKVVSEPSHSGKLQMGTTWYEIMPRNRAVYPGQFGGGFAGLQVAATVVQAGLATDIICSSTDVFTSTGPITITNTPCRVYGNGARFIQNTVDSVFSFTGSYTTPLAISAVGTNYVTIAAGPAMPTWSPGDIVKVVSEDTLDIFPTNALRGEHLSVLYIDPATRRVYFSSLLTDTYTTTPRIGKLNNVPFLIDGCNFEAVPGKTDVATWPAQSMIRIGNALNPQVRNVSTLISYGHTVLVVGSFGAIIDSLSIMGGYDGESGQDNPAVTGFLSYGVQISYSTQCHISNSQFKRLRHGVDVISSGSTSVTSDLGTYGASRNHLISDCIASGCINAGFGTHHGSMDVRFSSCHSIGGLNAGFTARGVNVTFDETCTSTRDARAFQALVQSSYVGSAITSRCSWRGSVYDPVNWAVLIYDGATEIDFGGVTDISVNRTSTEALFEVRGRASGDCTTYWRNATLYLRAPQTTMPRVFKWYGGNNVRLNISNLKVDCRGLGGMNSNPFIENTQDIAGNILIYADNVEFWTTSASATFGSFLKGALNASSRIRRAILLNLGSILDGVAINASGAVAYGPISLTAVDAPIGTYVGGMVGTSAFNPGSLAADASADFGAAITVPGAALGDRVECSWNTDLQGVVLFGWVSAVNTVKVRCRNDTASAIDLPAGTLTVRVTKN